MGSSSYEYDCDRLCRLATVGEASSASYSYDPVGHRPVGFTFYSYYRADRITNWGTDSYTVNANGNVAVRGNGTSSYLCDADGNLAGLAVSLMESERIAATQFPAWNRDRRHAGSHRLEGTKRGQHTSSIASSGCPSAKLVRCP